MLNSEYSEAISETLDILNHTDIEYVKKIPNEFIEFLKENSSKEYVPKLDHSLPMYEMNIKEETKNLLGTIYRNWWCSKEEKEKYEKIIQENYIKEQEELKNNYNAKEMFKKRTENINNNSTNNAVTIVNKKESILKNIINKIKTFFKRR